MQRYFVSKQQISHNKVTINGEDAHHIQRVMRLRPGNQLIVCDGAGREILAEISDFLKDAVTLSVVEERAVESEPLIQVSIAQSLPKGDKMEIVVQKCTEVGAVQFIPFLSARTVVQYDSKKEAKRLERWERIAKEAAEQSHRGAIPFVTSPQTWKQFLTTVTEFDFVLICYEQEQVNSLKNALQELKSLNGRQVAEAESPSILLIVGPEGGFEASEVEEIEAVGGHRVSLGKRILRTETAAVVGLSCILYEFEEL